jgi:hypothetical protein
LRTTKLASAQKVPFIVEQSEDCPQFASAIVATPSKCPRREPASAVRRAGLDRVARRRWPNEEFCGDWAPLTLIDDANSREVAVHAGTLDAPELFEPPYSYGSSQRLG